MAETKPTTTQTAETARPDFISLPPASVQLDGVGVPPQQHPVAVGIPPKPVQNVVYVADPNAPKQVPFKDQVVGYAKEIRGTLLHKPDLKEHGAQILRGEATVTTPLEKPATSEPQMERP